MIISKVPLRVGIIGGDSDRHEFLNQYIGAALNVAINQYVYITVNETFTDEYVVAYSQIERHKNREDITHTRAKQCIRTWMRDSYYQYPVEIHSIATLPMNGTGLGASSAYTVGLSQALKALSHHKRCDGYMHISEEYLYELAHKTEMACGSTGRQDILSAVYGGLNLFQMHNKQNFVHRIDDKAACNFILNSMFLIYTGPRQRESSDIINNTKIDNDTLSKMAAMATDAYNALLNGTYAGYTRFNELMVEANYIKNNSYKIENIIIDFLMRCHSYKIITAKQCGAGEGGFIVAHTKENELDDAINLVKVKFPSWKILKFGIEQFGARYRCE